MHAAPEVRVDDRIMLSGISLSLVQGLTPVDPVVQQPVQVALIDQRALLVAEALVAVLSEELGLRRGRAVASLAG